MRLGGPGTGKNKGASGTGLYDTLHQVQVLTYDNDENLFGGVGVPPGPSGQPPGSQSPNYIFLESQRINLLAATDWNPSNFKGGWVDLTLRNPAALTGFTAATGLYNMGWVGVQHTAPWPVHQRRLRCGQPEQPVPVLAEHAGAWNDGERRIGRFPGLPVRSFFPVSLGGRLRPPALFLL